MGFFLLSHLSFSSSFYSTILFDCDDFIFFSLSFINLRANGKFFSEYLRCEGFFVESWAPQCRPGGRKGCGGRGMGVGEKDYIADIKQLDYIKRSGRGHPSQSGVVLVTPTSK